MRGAEFDRITIEIRQWSAIAMAQIFGDFRGARSTCALFLALTRDPLAASRPDQRQCADKQDNTTEGDGEAHTIHVS
jgi:hypothetical protein